MSNNEGDKLEEEMDLQFPVITISVSYDDVDEPIHVDLGSIPPFVACSIFENILSVMKNINVGPKITFKGEVIASPEYFDDLIDFDSYDFDDQSDEEDEDDEDE